VGFIKVDRGNGHAWVNTDHIIRVTAGPSGARILTTATDDKGKSQTVPCRESVDQVMELIKGTGVEIVQRFPRA
jgi:hypothetical protein